MAGHFEEVHVHSGGTLDAKSASIPLIVIFDFTQIFGFVLLGIILLTAWLSSAIRRSSPWFNFLITWMISCFSYLVILGQQTGPEPHFSICLFQAMLIYAAPAVTVTAGLCFSIDLWRIVTRTTSERHSESPRVNVLLIIAPYIVHLLICVEVLVLGLKNPKQVRRDDTLMFCHMDLRTPPSITAGVVIVAIIVALTFVASTVIHLRRHWAAFRRLQIRQVANIHKMVIRFAIFSALPTLALALSIIQVSTDVSGIEYGLLTIAIGTLPVGAALIFGIQDDLLCVWMFWRTKRRSDVREPVDSSDSKASAAESA